jgi:hypothetical protein
VNEHFRCPKERTAQLSNPSKILRRNAILPRSL